MTEQPTWGIEPLTDKDGQPIAGRPLRVGDYVLLSGFGEQHKVQLTSQATHGADIVGFHCQAINEDGT